jgi:hypothetical protein
MPPPVLEKVLVLPPRATLLASSPWCAHEMYCVGARVLCMQGHPEFDAARLAEIARRRPQNRNRHSPAKPATQKPEVRQRIHCRLPCRQLGCCSSLHKILAQNHVDNRSALPLALAMSDSLQGSSD